MHRRRLLYLSHTRPPILQILYLVQLFCNGNDTHRPGVRHTHSMSLSFAARNRSTGCRMNSLIEAHSSIHATPPSVMKSYRALSVFDRELLASCIQYARFRLARVREAGKAFSTNGA